MQSEHPSRPRFVVRPSPVHGRGVFANRDICTSELVSEYKGARVRWQDVVQRASWYGKTPGHTFLFDVDDGIVIDGASGGNSMRWMNHGCEPNCKAYVLDGRAFIYALRPIKRGEELTIDYGLELEGPCTPDVQELYRCRCGSPNCRGTMLARIGSLEEIADVHSNDFQAA